jgi:hypothetical protein
MKYAIEIDEQGNTKPVMADRAKAMAAARREAIRLAKADGDSSNVYLLTFEDSHPTGLPNNAENAIGELVYVGHATRWGGFAFIDRKEGTVAA